MSPPPLSKLLAAALEHRDRVFLISAETGEALSYGQFHHWICATAETLRKRKIQPGQRVALLMPNSMELAAAYFSVFYCGAVAVAIHTTLAPRDIRYILNHSRADLLLTSPPMQKTAQEICPPDKLSVMSGYTCTVPDASPPADGGKSAVIVYTSGTTDKPKGIVHTLDGLFANAALFGAEHAIGPENRFYITLPMAYLGGFYNSLLLAFLQGSSVVVDKVFDVRSSINFWERPIQHQANTLWLSPTILAILLKMDRGQHGVLFCRERVRAVFSGFGPLQIKIKHDFQERYGMTVHNTYGLSETLFVSSSSDRFPGKTGSVGKPLGDVRVAIFGNEGKPLEAEQEGEIGIRTPHLMEGSLDEGGEIRREDPGEWHMSGDLGRIALDGSLFITGRKKDIIIRGGMNVSPMAIEEVLREFPGVSDAAVIGIPHEIYGEDIAAVVKLSPGQELDAIRKNLAVHAQRHLAPHQQPACYLSIHDFPMTPTGKVQKRHLLEMVLQKLRMDSGTGSFDEIPPRSLSAERVERT